MKIHFVHAIIKRLAFCSVLLFFALAAKAQFVTTVPPLAGTNNQSGITFNVKAFTSLNITEVWCSFLTGTYTVTVWYKTDSINGTPNITVPNGWVQACTNVPLTVVGGAVGIIQQVPFAFNIPMNSGNVYGFYVEVTSAPNTACLYYTNYVAPAQYIWGNSDMYINTGNGNVGYGGIAPSPANASRMFNGKIVYTTGPPCPGPTGLNATNILSATADVNWTAVASSFGYYYVVDQNPGSPAVTGTATTAVTANVTGLQANTTYYLHVRNRCSATNSSPWVHYSFKTLPPCKPPVNFRTTGLTSTSTNINWDVWLSALTYDYLVDQSSADPVSSTGLINTANTSVPITGLAENTWYYVHIRSKCAGNEVSGWSLDSFLTPIVCRPPAVQISHVNVDEAVAYWDAVNTAYEYEYAITQSAKPPTLGTIYNFRSIHTSALADGKEYFIHVRSHCESVGVQSMSDWASVAFKTFALGIDDEQAGGFGITCYPNPVKDIMTVSFGGSKADNPVLVLTDMSGRVLQNINNLSGNVKIDLSRLSQGMYLLKYSDNARTRVMPVSKY